ncbi:uncharacterized protein AMSG_11184 [Thecamonas trahens ATCC 50062]|uniref:Uncharacterized protein n=1 Tax=Thecamonas trahens ATCC 50062 TaxID=461836 RepID=A0A0L0DU51_THETB|nr:hypothetical protein AMSG_11184 [Thecamonas trahens ATCC 50062]KNC55722.1 hypothetical protein AMSG_11184 [Thecamonas trahens ATCC 50062]|eukprot:XP_013752930.1 hypothetical protein AMSG_11184 [Thecamonas trahens ATCC 50062]
MVAKVKQLNADDMVYTQIRYNGTLLHSGWYHVNSGELSKMVSLTLEANASGAAATVAATAATAAQLASPSPPHSPSPPPPPSPPPALELVSRPGLGLAASSSQPSRKRDLASLNGIIRMPHVMDLRDLELRTADGRTIPVEFDTLKGAHTDPIHGDRYLFTIREPGSPFLRGPVVREGWYSITELEDVLANVADSAGPPTKKRALL